MKKQTKHRLLILAAAILLNLIMNTAGNALKTEHYTIVSDKLTLPVRIVFISDLHNCTYGGSDQSALCERIDAESPDLVLFGGDVIDSLGGTKHALRLMELLRASYPCAYAAGNHEGRRKDTAEFYADVQARGIPVLNGETEAVTVNGQSLRLCGIVDAANYPQQLEAVCPQAAADCCNILLLHQPEQLDLTAEECEKDGTAFDLILSGHAHGGQWRIPGLLEQGLYAPDQGIFPEFTGGQRTRGETVQIVSRGLAKQLKMLLIPRIFNRPELSVIDMIPQ